MTGIRRRGENVKVFDNLKDGYGNTFDDRVLLFVPHDELESDGSIGGYSLGNNSINNKRGYTFIIDKSDESKIAQCKVVNGELTIN